MSLTNAQTTRLGLATLKEYAPALGLWLLADTALLLGGQSSVTLFGGVLLYTYLPGTLLVGWLFKPADLTSVERGVLGAVASYNLSTFAVLALHFLPGPLTLLQVVAILNVLMLVLLILGARQKPVPTALRAKIERWELVFLTVLILLTLTLRLVSLGYSEYQGDEVDVTRLAKLALIGQPDAFLLHRKGPTEIVIAASFALFNKGFSEFGLRLPFALASVWAVIATYALGRRLFTPQVGVLAGALLALNGIFLGFSRMVQYQSVVLLAIVSAVFCFRLIGNQQEAGVNGRFAALGVFLYGFGLLTHYEVGPIGLVLLLLIAEKGWLSKKQGRELRATSIAVIFTALALLAYYVPFVLHPHFGETFQRYTQIRISVDRAPFNNLGEYLTSALFYNSVYYEALMSVGLLTALWLALRTAFAPAHRLGAAVAWCLFAIGFVGSELVPAWIRFGPVRLGIFLVLPALILIWGRGNSSALRGTILWFGIYLLAYAFLIRTPGLHYYTLLPAWTMLTAWGIAHMFNELPVDSGRVLLVCSGALGILIFYHPLLLFLQTSPEYALTYPRSRHPLYPNTLKELPDRFFGLPHRSGWKTIGYLFEAGILKGEYRSNEKEEITGWYIGASQSEADRPTYYLIADNPTEKEHKQDYPKELLAIAYREIGTITVEKEPRIHIYSRLSDKATPIGIYHDEEIAPLFDQMNPIPLPTVWP